MAAAATVTVRYKKELQVSSARPITAEDVSVSVGPLGPSRSTGQPNSMATATLWAHFQAHERDLLQAGAPAPWERLTPEAGRDAIDPEEHARWLAFLAAVITDTSWTVWIRDAVEARRHTSEGYGAIHNPET